MAKYRTKPCEIEAIQYTGDNLDEIVAFTEKQAYWGLKPMRNGDHIWASGALFIRTLEGEMEASEGDYIIRGLRGEYYPCKPDVFAKKYELLED